MPRTPVRAKWGPEPPRSVDFVVGGEVFDLQQPAGEVGLFLCQVAGGAGEPATLALEPGQQAVDGIETLGEEGILGLIDHRVHGSSPYRRNADEEAGTAGRRTVRDRDSGRLGGGRGNDFLRRLTLLGG